MRAIFGVMALVIVLAAVAFVARSQLGATTGSLATRNADAAKNAAALAADPGGSTAENRPAPRAGVSSTGVANDMKQQARDRAVQALQQGEQRNTAADP